MRARNIKPDYYRDADLADLPLEARFIFPGLWMMADCVGRMEDSPRRIKAELLPYDDISVGRVHELLQLLADGGFILRYEATGARYIQIHNFLKHQNPHKKEREAGSQLPPPMRSAPVSIQSGSKPALGPENPVPDPVQAGTSSGNSGASPADSGFLIPDSRFPDKPPPRPPSSMAEPLTEFEQSFIGEFPSDTWKAFMSEVNTPELLELLRFNTPLWMKTRKYRDGFGKDARQYLRSGIWHKPPQKELTDARDPPGKQRQGDLPYDYKPDLDRMATPEKLAAERAERRRRFETEHGTEATS